MSFCDFNHLIETKSQDGWVWRSSTFFCVAGEEKKKRVSYSDKQKEKNRLNLLRVFIWQTKGWILSWWWRCHHHCRCHRSNCRCRCHCRHRRRCRSRSCSHCRRMQFVCAQPWKMTPHILGRWWGIAICRNGIGLRRNYYFASKNTIWVFELIDWLGGCYSCIRFRSSSV